MKKTLFFSAAMCLMCSVANAASAPKGTEIPEYRRNSLNFIMLDVSEGDAEITSIFRQAFTEMTVPVKYNDHNVAAELRSFTLNSMEITDADHEAYATATGTKKKNGGFGKALGGLMGGTTTEFKQFGPTKKNSPVAAWKYLNQSGMAKEMFAKWFVNPQTPDELSVDLLRERANFNATQTEKVAAEGSSRGVFNQIADDAGYELLNNTFAVVTRFRYMNGQDMYDEIIEDTEIVAQYLPAQAFTAAMTAATAAAIAAKQVIGDGYVIYTTTYLYQLVWDDEVQQAVESNWNVDGFNSLDCFRLKYIGSENAYANVLGNKFAKEEAIRLATNRAMEKVLAKLERKYEVFRTKTPLTGVDPLTADIGTKECVEKGDKYEVLEKTINPKTNKVDYKRKALLEVETVGNNITDGSEEVGEDAATRTTFKGKAKNLYPGMLLRQTTK
ncbi:hypothetical protein [Alistipes muris]|uniref:hypothetical protein n=1 Tax=Alistipes muris TaxID=2941326 RepID=UPI002040B094|nr:hypothetical protein [Alistipes muris]MCX4281603.1 hypothetical protein [Alistipes sp.]